MLVGALLIYFKACLLPGFTEKGIRENFMFYIYLGKILCTCACDCMFEGDKWIDCIISKAISDATNNVGRMALIASV